MPKLIPTPDEITKPFWDAINERRLTIQNCMTCDLLQYPPLQNCSKCGSPEGLEWKDIEGRGHITSYIVIEDGRLDRRMPDQPYNLAVVSLDSDTGINFYSNLPGVEVDKVPVGVAVRVIFEECGPGQLIHEWELVD